MLKTLPYIVVFLMSAILLQAQNSSLLKHTPLATEPNPSDAATPPLITAVKTRVSGNHSPDAGFLTIDRTVFAEYLGSKAFKTTIAIPFAGNIVEFSAQRFELFAPSTQFLTHANGVESAFVPDACILLSGSASGLPGSFLYLAVFENYAAGYIDIPRDGGLNSDRWVIAPLTLEPTSTSTMIVVREQELKTTKSSESYCRSEELPEYTSQIQDIFHEMNRESNKNGKKSGEKILHSETLTVQVALDLDDALYSAHQSNVSRAANYVATVWGGVSAIYFRDANVRFQIPYMRIWTTTDPYPATGTGMLGQFRQYWNANMRHVPRTIAHLMSGHGFGGVAWVGVLCNEINGGYGYAADGIGADITYPSPGYIWDLDVVAHETGHNFGSPHTHNCGWAPAIDSCYTAEGGCFQGTKPRSGSIMSYCHLTSFATQLHIHSRVASLMRDRAEKASCIFSEQHLTKGDIAVHTISVPSLGAALRVNSAFVPAAIIANIGVEQQSSFLVRFQILEPVTGKMRYSDSTIVPGLNPGQQTTTLFRQTSVQDTGQYLAKAEIVVANDVNTFNNQKTQPFVVKNALPQMTITVADPDGGEQTKSGENFTIRWTHNGLSRVAIEYSVNNGGRWETVISSYPADSLRFVWKLPFTSTTQAKVRIFDFYNSATKDESNNVFVIDVRNDVQPIDFVEPKENSNYPLPTIVPKIAVRNNGSDIQTNVPVRLRIVHSASAQEAYNETVQVNSIEAKGSAIVEFPKFTVLQKGIHEIYASTILTNDDYPVNDSLVRAFTADSVYFLPQLLSPANFSSTAYPDMLLRWSKTPNAVNYTIEAEQKPDFTAPIFRYETTDTTVFLPNLFSNPKIIYWRVRANAEGQLGNWSAVWTYYPIEWKINPDNGHWYMDYGVRSAKNVYTFAQEAGVYPVTVRNKKESEWLRSNFEGELRLGTTDEESEGIWKWLSGENFTYSNWAQNQPDNFRGEEHYVQIRGNGTWNDVGENAFGQFSVIELPRYLQRSPALLAAPTLTIPENNTFPNFPVLFHWSIVPEAQGYFFQIAETENFAKPITTIRTTVNAAFAPETNFRGSGMYYWRLRSFSGNNFSPWSTVGRFKAFVGKTNPENGHKYDVISAGTWEDCQRRAAAIGANLTTIRNAKEQEWLLSTFGTGNYWIGLHDKNTEGAFEWVKGDTSTYRYWGGGQPDNYQNNEDYVHITNTPEGFWNDNGPSASMNGLIEFETPKIPAPNIVAPNVMQLGVSLPLMIRWNPIEGIAIYTIQISRDPLFSSLLFNESKANDTSIVITTLPDDDTGYYLRVRGRNLNNGEWSSPHYFTLKNTKPSGQKLHFSFDNIETEKVFDESGSFAVGVLSAAWANFTDGKIRRGMVFDGNSDAIDGVLPIATEANDFSLCFWVRNPDSGVIFSTSSVLLSVVPTAEKPYLHFTRDNNVDSIAMRWDKSRWVHVALTVSQDVLHWYINGKALDSAENIKGAGLLPAELYALGTGKGKYYRGELDDFKLYDRALTKTDVADIIGDKLTGLDYNETQQTNGISIYPNPSHTAMRFITADSGILTIVNARGETMQTLAIDNEANIDVSQWPSGIFGYVFRSKNTASTGTFIVQQ